MPDSFYHGRTALVTGASAGIGADLARQLGAAGARVVLVARREDALATVAGAVRQAGGEAVVLAADLEPPGAAAASADRLTQAGETIDVLVNNAGFGVQSPLVETDSKAVEGMVGLNVTTLTLLTRALVPGMVQRGRGGVLNVASIAAFTPAPSFAVYAASKAYVQSFTEALWAELRDTPVHVTCLCPGPVETDFGQRAGMAHGFFTGGLPSSRVAREGLDGLAAGRRRVVPGWTSKIQTAATRFVPPAALLHATARIMKRAE